MDLDSFEKRLAAVMPHMMAVGDDGVARPTDDFVTLERDVAQALATQNCPAGLHELAQAMTMMRESLQDPGVAMSVVAVQSGALTPNPDICTAIEDHDIDAMRKALQHWDVNRTFGEFNSTALYHAMSCMFGISLDIIHLLLDAGADPRKGLGHTNVLHGLGFANLDGVDPAELAEVVRRCVELGADIEQRSNKLQWTPLITAVSEWNPVATEALLLAGADINARAGDVEGVCLSGAGCLAFAEGHTVTTEVLRRYLTRN